MDTQERIPVEDVSSEVLKDLGPTAEQTEETKAGTGGGGGAGKVSWSDSIFVAK